MKKILMILFSIILSWNTYANNFTNGKEYYILSQPVLHVPKIIDCFSFFCPYCYEFEQKHHIRHFINQVKDKNIIFHSYHVNFFGGKLSTLLTKAWIMAKYLRLEEKIMIPFFKAVQETHTIKNEDSIRALFIKETNISVNQYNKLWNSSIINTLVQKQEKYINKIPLDHVPAVIIQGKYILDYYLLEKSFKDDFVTKYISLLKFLSTK
ncbi:DsbA family protein [Buchnera aphidicola]|uniref:DsbA family protein n=1 Tax=Buchnera aphidicola TaxID=9 RepID=UPI003463E556